MDWVCVERGPHSKTANCPLILALGFAVLAGCVSDEQPGTSFAEAGESQIVPIIVQGDPASRVLAQDVLEANPLLAYPGTDMEYSIRIFKPHPDVDHNILQMKPDKSVDYTS